MAEWKFAVEFTNRAKADYGQLKTVAESRVSPLRPLPSNSDPSTQADLAIVEHYDRTRKILTSLKDPQAAHLDLRLMGGRSYVSYRTNCGTTVYFQRSIKPLLVTVYYISDAPLDYDALFNLVFSGRAHSLPEVIGIRIPLSQLERRLTIN